MKSHTFAQLLFKGFQQQMNTQSDLKYILITPARNEEAFIETTIKSVVSQTHLPEKWIIVSDGSSDRTDEIVNQYVRLHPWIDLIRMPEHRDRQFAAKVNCFNTAYARVQDLFYDIIGNLDADISFDSEYLSYLMSKFRDDPDLGVAGTPFVEGDKHYDYRFTNIEHVSGACQLFRRECFQDIGGYIPIKTGGIDWIAVTTARMKGWKTRTFLDKTCQHHRKLGTGDAGSYKARFRDGVKDYSFGSHPVWELFRSVYQMKTKPHINGLLIMSGYLWAAIRRHDRPVSDELLRFYRDEQMMRLKNILLRVLGTKNEATKNILEK
jgi:glycosyltransferase involved in cell wall biosynthesis